MGCGEGYINIKGRKLGCRRVKEGWIAGGKGEGMGRERGENWGSLGRILDGNWLKYFTDIF
jgi:hypothetical protein